MIRPSSIYEDYLRQPAKPDVPATVLVVSQQGTVDVQLASGEVLRRVDLAGAASAGDRVMLRYDDHGNYTALGSRPSSAASGAAFVTATGGGSSGGSGTIPDPHDLLGAHHTLPTVSAGQVFAAPASSSGTPSFRALATTDLPTLTVSAGDGLTGGGNLPSITLNVGAGDGITVGASTVSVRRAAISGLSFSSGGLQMDDSIAGAGLSIASKVLRLSDGVAGAGLSINTTTKAISVGAGDGISVGSSPSAVSVKLRTESPTGNTSGLQFDGTGGLFVGAGDGIAVTSQSVRINLYSSGGNASGMQFDGGALKVGAGDGISVGSNVVAVDNSVARSSWKVNAGNGLAVTNSGNLSSSGPTFSVGAGAGISVLTSSVAVNQAFAFSWTASHAFGAGLTATTGSFSSTLSVTGATTLQNKLQVWGPAASGGANAANATANIVGSISTLPAASGSPDEAAIRVRGNSGTTPGSVVLDASTSSLAGWMQVRNVSDYSILYPLLLNPNGGNVGINRTNATFALHVTGTVGVTDNVTFSKQLDVSGATAIGGVLSVNSSATIFKGLNLGTSTGALDGQIRASNGLVTTTGSFSGSVTIAAGQTLRIGSGTGDVDLSRKASDILALGSGDAMESTTYQSGVSGWQINAAGTAEFANIRVRGELAATVFKKKLVSATSGTLGVYQSASTLVSNRTTPSAIGGSTSPTSWPIKNDEEDSALYSINDIVQIKAWSGTGVVDVWMQVTGRTVLTGGYSNYNFTLLSGATSTVVTAGTPIINWGQSGDGVLTLSADGAIGASPNLSVLTHAGVPYSTTTLRARLGNLNGSYGYSTNTYGFAAGDSATTFLSADSTNGVRVVRDTTTRFQVDTSGALTIRNTAGNAVITMDSTSARIDSDLLIGAGGVIRQGTGTWTSTFTGLGIDAENSRGRIRFFEGGAIRAAFGNLNGNYGYTTDIYGIAAGSSTNYTAADANGFRVANNSVVRFAVDTQGNISLSDSGGVQRMALTSTGVFVAGDTATSSIWADATNGFRVRNNNVSRFSVDTSGNVALRDGAGVQRIGLTSAGVIELDDATGAARVLIDSGGLKLRDSNGNAAITLDASGNSQFTGVMTIGASGEIRQGTGSLTASPATFTGTRIWNDAGVGRVAGYNSGALQWYAGTDGKLKAGSGDVTLDSDGISLVSWVSSRGSIGSVNGYRFSAFSTTFCGMYATTNATVETTLSVLNYGDTSPSIAIEAQDTSIVGGSASSVTLTAKGPSYSANIRLDQSSANLYGVGLRITSTADFTAASAGTLYASGSGSFAGGLNVGSATGAATGEVRAHELYLGTGSDVRLYRSAADMLRTPDSATIDGGLNVGSATGAGTGDVKFSGSLVGTGTEGLRTTWTPTFEWSGGGTGTFTYATQSAVYTKIANVVYIAARITLSGFTIGTSTGNLRIANLPFTVANITPLPVVSVAGCSFWTTVTPDRGIFFNNTTYLLLYSGPLSTQTIGTGNITANSSIYVSGFYYTT